MWVAAKGTDVIFLFVMVNSSTESTKATSPSVAEPSVKLTFRVCQTLQTIRRIDAAKLLKSVPEVADRINSGTLNLSQACLLQKCLESDAKKGEATSAAKTQEILKKLEDCNGFETRQVLAREFDMPIKIQDIVRPQKQGSVRLEITLTTELFEELKDAKSFLSHVVHNGSWAEVISALAIKLNQSKREKQNKSSGPVKSELNSATEFKNPDLRAQEIILGYFAGLIIY